MHHFRVLSIIGLSLLLLGCNSTRKKIYAGLTGQGKAVTPFHVADNLYYVGTQDIAVYLLETEDGFILIDTAYEHLHDQVLSNIKAVMQEQKQLSVKPKDIKIILNTQAHMDHAGGIERMRSVTHAEVKALPQSLIELKDGSEHDFSWIIRRMPFTPLDVKEGTTLPISDAVLDSVSFEHGGMTLTAFHTPGHTKGCTSWSFTLDIQGHPRKVLLVCGFKRLPFTKLKNNKKYLKILANYDHSFQTLETLQDNCDILLSPHMSHFETGTTLKALSKNDYLFETTACSDVLGPGLKKIKNRVAKANK